MPAYGAGPQWWRWAVGCSVVGAAVGDRDPDAPGRGGPAGLSPWEKVGGGVAGRTAARLYPARRAESSVSLYVAGPVLADRIGVAVLIGCDS